MPLSLPLVLVCLFLFMHIKKMNESHNKMMVKIFYPQLFCECGGRNVLVLFKCCASCFGISLFTKVSPKSKKSSYFNHFFLILNICFLCFLVFSLFEVVIWSSCMSFIEISMIWQTMRPMLVFCSHWQIVARQLLFRVENHFLQFQQHPFL